MASESRYQQFTQTVATAFENAHAKTNAIHGLVPAHARRLLVFAERALGRRNGAVEPLVYFHRLAQSPRGALEAGLDNMVRVAAINVFDVQADAGILREGLEPFLEQLGVH